jgi:uncharacterized membrane protein YtjA (UPF0391 family)
MLGWAVTFFILAVVSAILGFGELAGTFTWFAELLFFGFVILFVVTIVANLVSGRRTPPPV